MLEWAAFENGELMHVHSPGTMREPYSLKEKVRELVQAREGFAPEEGKLSWESFEDEVYELWWLPYDHNPSVDLQIRIKKRYVGGRNE